MGILNKQSLLRSDYSCGIKPGAGTFLRKNRHTSDIETTVYETGTSDADCLPSSEFKFKVNEIMNINKDDGHVWKCQAQSSV